MTKHILVVEPPIAEGFVLRTRVECPGLSDSCRAWDECMKRECRDPDDETLDRLHDEAPVHGVVHAHLPGLGWCVPTESCWPQVADASEPASELDLEPGRYEFDWESEDGDFLILKDVVRVDAQHITS